MLGHVAWRPCDAPTRANELAPSTPERHQAEYDKKNTHKSQEASPPTDVERRLPTPMATWVKASASRTIRSTGRPSSVSTHRMPLGNNARQTKPPMHWRERRVGIKRRSNGPLKKRTRRHIVSSRAPSPPRPTPRPFSARRRTRYAQGVRAGTAVQSHLRSNDRASHKRPKLPRRSRCAPLACGGWRFDCV